jgi:hypothetical protein
MFFCFKIQRISSRESRVNDSRWPSGGVGILPRIRRSGSQGSCGGPRWKMWRWWLKKWLASQWKCEFHHENMMGYKADIQWYNSWINWFVGCLKIGRYDQIPHFMTVAILYLPMDMCLDKAIFVDSFCTFSSHTADETSQPIDELL